ncbi:MAG: glycosyltransferase, partial [Planctomycetota bacterium]
REPGTMLLIAGKQEGGQPLEELLVDVEGARYDAGFVPEKRVQLYMRASDVVVLPYRDILTSGAAVLASTFARACIAPHFGCMRDALHPSGAFFYDPGRADALRGAMREAHRHRPELDGMGERNRALVEQWPWSEVARRTAALYRNEKSTISAASAAAGDSATR